MDKSVILPTACLALLMTGCDQVGEQASKAVEQRVQKETTQLIEKALGSVDKTLAAVGPKAKAAGIKPNILADGSLQVAGITSTSVSLGRAPARVAAIYFTFERTVDSKLEARFLNNSGAEIGRDQKQISVPAGTGQYVEFEVDPRTALHEISTISLRIP